MWCRAVLDIDANLFSSQMHGSNPEALSLPVELLLEIIIDSISLPQFLDVDNLPAVTNPLPPAGQYSEYVMEDTYWKIERQRNILRRVCKSFDAYLRLFDHRFVRISDVFHGYVPADTLLKAKRIDLTSICPKFRYQPIECEYCWPSGTPQGRLVPLIDSAIPDDDFAVEIIAGPGNYTHVGCFLAMVQGRLPHLKAVFDLAFVEASLSEELTLAFTSVPQLKFISMNGKTYKWSLCKASNLTTLEYTCRRNPFPAWLGTKIARRQLPRLQHLRLSTVLARNVLPMNKLIDILLVFGDQLRSLRIGGCRRDAPEAKLPAECWELCPRLERIDTTLHLTSPPAPHHPLHTISTFAPGSYYRTSGYLEPFQMNFIHEIAIGSNIRRIILQRSREAISRAKADPAKETWFRDCGIVCAEKGIRLEDIVGAAL